ncbi:MAG: MMPL family transporter [Chloroflexota bacterium]|nr:MMPL family transporter [Chloroflexota bacterium]
MTQYLAAISARRPIIVIVIWVLLLLASAGVVDRLLPSATTTDFKLADRYESQQAAKVLEEGLRGPAKSPEIVILRSDSLTVEDPAFRAKVEQLHLEISSLGPDIISGGLDDQSVSDFLPDLVAAGVPDSPISHYYQIADAGPALPAGLAEQLLPILVSADGDTVMMHYTLAGSVEEAIDNVPTVIHIVEEANREAGFEVLIGGDASVAHENNELAEQDLQNGERFGVPVAFLVLLVLFGALVATLIPLGLSAVSIAVALAAVAIIGQTFPLLFFVNIMVVMIGLAVGIDYSLLIVLRFKEELNHGYPVREAVARTGNTAGRTVFFSGATVVLALVGLFIVPSSFYQSLALGAILVVVATLAATLTLLPAVLSLLGHRVNFLTIPFINRFALKGADTSTGGFWDKITHIVTWQPVISLLIVGVPMLILSWFYLDIRTGLNDVNTFPDKAETKKAFLLMEEEFSFGEVTPAGFLSPADIVISGDVDSPQVQEAIGKLQQSLAADPTFPLPPQPPVVNERRDLALLVLPFPGKSTTPEAADNMEILRERHIADAFRGVPAEVLVGGLTAEVADFYGIVRVYTPIVFAFVLGLSFLILMMVFRSIVIPLKAIIMNLLSVGATYGLLVLVFQKGFGAELLGFQQADVIDAWLPLFLFTILFGLSMDYHVFLLSRIRERYDESGDNTEAVAYGLRSTAGLITGAALIMVVVFGAFATGETVVNQLMGFGLAIAVFLDATLVRSVLVPASMEVLGKGNWYLPPFLRWLPDLRVEGEEGH